MGITRREFVAGIAGGATAAIVAPAVASEASPRSYKACVIGNTKRGGYGHGLGVCFQKIPRVAVAAVADPDPAGREAAARKAGAARSYADWEEMLRKEKPDIISIGPRWVEARIEMIRAAAGIGAHVYMEKPIAASLEEADAMVEAAGKGGIKVAVALQALLAPGIVHLKKLVAEGLIGNLLEMRTRGKEDHRSGGEDLMVLGTHCMYLQRFFSGDALWCSARVLQGGREVTASDRRAATEPLGPVAGDTIHATYAFPGGVQGHFDSMKVPAGQGGRFAIALHGSKGIVTVHVDADPKAFLLRDPLWSPGRTGAPWEPIPGAPSNDDSGLRGAEASNKRIVEDLIRAAETGGEPVAGIREARAALEMILAVYASHLKGGRAAIPLQDRRHPLGKL
jgi:predicted dehydrogenase